jgi:hypothetical protein
MMALPGSRGGEIEPVVLAVRGFDYPAELQAILEASGCVIERVQSLEDAAAVLAVGRARALLVGARHFTRRDRLALRLCRLVAPETALVIVAGESTPACCLVEALDCRVAALLYWPGDGDAVRRSVTRGMERAPETAP